jgi:hypothetical protein
MRTSASTATIPNRQGHRQLREDLLDGDPHPTVPSVFLGLADNAEEMAEPRG